jgi:hypothetical protein
MKFHAPVSGNKSLDLPLVFGHFLPWFTIRGGDYPIGVEDRRPLKSLPVIDDYRHWCDPRSGYKRTHYHMPEVGQYDSRDPKIIEWQIRTALEFGVSGFIINWYGKQSAENIITLHWLRGLQRWNREHPDRPFYYFISFDWQAQWPSEGKTCVTREEDFAYIRDYLITDAYLRRDGNPVFSVFPRHEKDSSSDWRQTLDVVFGPRKADLIWRGFPGEGEDAAYAWVQPDDETIDLGNPHCWSQPDSVGEKFLAKFYDTANAAKPGVGYLMHGAWPGFNNQFVSWAWSPDPTSAYIRPCVLCRETTRGNTLDLTWRVYLDYLARWANGDPAARIPAPLIQLVTWNDYAETTTVEPTRDYGTAPLQVCRARLAQARKLWRQ